MEKVKILVVDDESRMRKLVKDFLVRSNYEVLEAEDGEKALDIFFADNSIALIISYVVLIWLAEISIMRSRTSFVESYAKKIITRSPYTPGVSIVAPAYNEERTIVDNVYSLLGQDYPKFEVVIVNDGSKDSTLEK